MDIPLVPVSMITGVIENNAVSDERGYNRVLSGVDAVLKKIEIIQEEIVDDEDEKNSQNDVDDGSNF